MDGNLIHHDLLQRVKEHERKIELDVRNYHHLHALRETSHDEPTRLAGPETLTMRISQWLRERLPSLSGPARVNVNLHIAIVYAGAEPVGELVYGGERIAWNQFIDAIQLAVQSKLAAGRANEGGEQVRVSVK